MSYAIVAGAPKREIHVMFQKKRGQSMTDAAMNGNPDLTLTLPASRKRVAPCLFLSVAFFIVVFALPASAAYSIALCPVILCCAFGFLAIAIHDATLKHSIIVRQGVLVVRRKTIVRADEKTFGDIQDISLAKFVKGHGVAPLSLVAARREFDKYQTHPPVIGLMINSRNRFELIALSLPLESLLSLGESLKQYGQEQGIFKEEPGIEA